MIQRTCRISNKAFVIEREDIEFYAKMGVITEAQLSELTSLQVGEFASVSAEKIPKELLVGLPTLCPEERQRRRLCFRNERSLYVRKCDATQDKIMSVYDAQAPFPVYNLEHWWSDNWDPFEYGQEFDFTRPFFEQYQELLNKVPRFPLIVILDRMENSHYTNACAGLKNCYLIFNADESEQCAYGRGVFRCFDCFDCLKIHDCQAAYELINCKNCSFSSYLFDCENCYDSNFCANCIGCSNCFGCVNLRNKEYYFLNKKYTQDEYEEKLRDIREKYSLSQLREFFDTHRKQQPVKALFETNTESVTGNYLINSKNAINCFDCENTEDCKFCSDLSSYMGPNFANYDVSIFGDNMKHCYESVVVGYGSSELRFCENVWGCSNISYSSFCFHNTQDCFGCVGLRKKQYCILNKQYTKEEYEALLPKIIEHMKKTGEWGELFPVNMSAFAYNETVANEYFPLTKDQIEARGYGWKEDKQSVNYSGPKYEIPEKIEDVPDDIVTKVLECERSGKFYRIQKAELKFYRKMNLPIPRLHPDERHKDRMALQNPRKLYKRKCADCGCEIQTTFAPDRPEKVLCGECYLKIVD